MQDLPILGKIKPYLESIELLKLQQQILSLQFLRVELNTETRKALAILQETRRRMLWPKDKDLTELDRKTRMNADCAEYEQSYEFLLKLENIVQDQIDIMKILLK